MANESELRKQMEAAYPVSQWSRTTAADGKWLNKNTIKPLNDRDDFLADAIDGFDAKIQAEAVARAAADTTIEQSFDKEAKERAAADTSLDTRIDGYRDDLEAHKKLDAETNEFGHLKNDKYKKFNDAATTVETNKDKWDNISTIKVGSTDVIGNNVTITGTKNIDVTADSSTKTITVKTTGTVGNSTTPIYMKTDGSFEACTGGSTNKFGNAIISVNENNAYSISYINNSNEPPDDHKHSQMNCPSLYSYEANEGRRAATEVLTTKILNDCITDGANNFIIRYDGIKASKVEITSDNYYYNITPSENIMDLCISVEKLEKYKMYTINLVPLALNTLSRKCISSLPEGSGRMQYSLTFSADPTKFIDYSDANYKCYTYGYLYNVPAFGINRRDAYACEFKNGNDTDFQYVIPSLSENNEVNNERWQINLNDTSEYDYDFERVYTDIDLKTMQAHSELSLFTSNTLMDCNDNELNGGTFNQLGTNKISAIMMELAGQYDESGTNTRDRLTVFRRQLSFMRGQDMKVDSHLVSDYSKTIGTNTVILTVNFKLDSTTKKVTVGPYVADYASSNRKEVNDCYKKLNNTTAADLNTLKTSVMNTIRKSLNKTSSNMPDSYFTFEDDTAENSFSVSYKLSSASTAVAYTISAVVSNAKIKIPYCYWISSTQNKLVADFDSTYSPYTKADPAIIIKNFNKKINDGNYSKDDLTTLADDFRAALREQIPQIRTAPSESISVNFVRCSVPAQEQDKKTEAYKLQWSYTIPQYYGYTLYFFTEATY